MRGPVCSSLANWGAGRVICCDIYMSYFQVITSTCIILIATGVGITVVSMVGFCGAVQRNPHCMLGVSCCTSLIAVKVV